MNIGLLFDLRNPTQWHRPWPRHYGRTLEFCEEADHLGIGGLWFTEHHLFPDGYLPQPLTFAAAAAARTRNARIGTSVVVPALRKPAQLAEEAAVVDLISGGRLELGLGAGYREPEYRLFDTDIRKRFTLTEQSIIAMRDLWDVITPSPVQDPVPLWGGFYGPRGARMAGRLGMGLLHTEGIEHYQAGLAEGGHDPATARVAGLLPVILADDPDAAWQRVTPHLVHQMNSYRAAAVEGTGTPEPPPLSIDELRRGDADGPWGTLEILTPEAAATRIASRIRGLPVQHLIFWASIAGMPDNLVAQNIELLSVKLPPLLQEALA